MSVGAKPGAPVTDPWGILDEIRALRAEVAELRTLRGAVRDLDDELVTIECAATIRDCSQAAIYKLIERGKLKSTRQGRAVRVRRGDVAMLAARARGTR